MERIPTIAEWSGPVYMRIVEALSADIASGRLVPGAATSDTSRPARKSPVAEAQIV